MTLNERTAFLLGDYASVADLSRTDTGLSRGYTDRETLERYFYGGDENDVPLANKDGAIYLQQLVHYIVGTLMPSSGEWINIDTVGIENPELLKQISTVEQHMASSLSKTNFYHRMTELVFNALIYNKAIIEPIASTGLSFSVHDHETLAVSDLDDGFSNRAYSEKDVTVDELRKSYNGVPDELMMMGDAEAAESTVTVVKGIVPNREPFVPAGKFPKQYKFATVVIVSHDDGSALLTPKSAALGYKTFPIVSFAPYGKQSLAELALPAAEMANRFAKALIERADVANHPPVAMSLETEIRKGYSLSAGGLVPYASGEQPPTPIATQLDLAVSEKTIAQQQQILRNVFKTDYIMRTQIANLSQFEYNQYRYNALAAIEPMVADLVNKAIPTVLMRVHLLLKKLDPKYKKAASNLEPNFVFTHLNRQLAESKKLANLGRLGQLVTPFAQLNPQSMVALDVDKALTEAATLAGHPELVRSEKDKQEIQQAQVEQQQQLQQQELETERMKAEGGGEQNGQN